MEDSENQSAVARQDGTPALFQCARCSRCFARVDHLQRHIRTHTKEKPHRCRTCNASFARADLLRRHAIRHADPADVISAATSSASRTRTAKACHACASKKLKCDDGRPCRRCVRRGLDCGGATTNGNSSHTPPHTPDLLDPFLQPDDDIVDAQSVDEPKRREADRHDDRAMYSLPDRHLVTATTDGRHCDDSQMEDFPISGTVAYADHVAAPYTDFLKDLLFATPGGDVSAHAQVQGLSDAQRSNFFFDFDFDSTSMGHVPFEEFPTLAPSGLDSIFSEDHISHLSPEQAVQDAANKAFTTSVWHWVPTKNDTQEAGQSHLALPADSSAEPDQALILDREILSTRLKPSDRDRVLTLLLGYCARPQIGRIASSFPSSVVLERLVQTALHFQTIGTIPWLHTPTFDPATARDELLAALAAYGAFLTPISAFQNLALAITDILFVHCAEKWGQNNANTRDLELWQCWSLVLHLMFWSGSKRKTEIGESHFQPLLTMLRRSGTLSREYYVLIRPSFEDPADDLDKQWREWAKRESTTRLVHHLFMHDAQLSMTLFTNPLMSAAEMHLPLPASDLLWSASTAEEWRIQTLQSSSDSRVSLSESARNALNQIAVHVGAEHDVPTSTVLTLYGLWSLVWDCQMLTSWLSTDALGCTPSATLSDPRIDLLGRVLSRLASDVRFTDHARSSAKQSETSLLWSYLQLALHAPLRCMPVFAGRNGKAEAETVLLTLKEWAYSRTGRESLWYAGQIFECARTMHKSLRQTFFAVAIYHASLTFWTFEILLGARQRNLEFKSDHWASFDNTTEPVVRVDHEYSLTLGKFFAIGEGIPAVSGANGDLILMRSNPGALMQAGRAILLEQAQSRENHLPRFIDNLLQLMDNLSRAAKSVGFD